MSIFPLPVFEADADPHHRSAMSDEEIYARLEAPKSIVVKFGYMKLVGEFPYEGDAKPGCGSKLVARTHRGTELVEMLTTTCANSGCSKSVSRQEMREYIDNSGGKDYPFHTKGRILRVATIEDLNKQSELESLRQECVRFCKAQIVEMGLTMKMVEAEAILGGEVITFYYMCEDRIDFRDLVHRLASQFHTRIEMRQVAARDEARLVADYERCGQHCCCKNFLKVLKPISMRSAKVQKATLDPLKISGRCGRLMCCLRYEDQTYKELKANLPPKNKRVGTSEGPAVVIDSKILVQLVLVRLEHDGKELAVPVEELMDPETCPKPGEMQRRKEEAEAESDPFRGLSEQQVKNRTEDDRRNRPRRDKRRDRDGGAQAAPPAPSSGSDEPVSDGRTKHEQQDAFREQSQSQERGERRRGRDRKRNRGADRGPQPERRVEGSTGSPPPGDGGAQSPTEGGSGGPIDPATGGSSPQGHAGRKKRRRRRRRRGGGGAGGGGDGGGGEGGE